MRASRGSNQTAGNGGMSVGVIIIVLTPLVLLAPIVLLATAESSPAPTQQHVRSGIVNRTHRTARSGHPEPGATASHLPRLSGRSLPREGDRPAPARADECIRGDAIAR
jgi:hypothetical protein